MGVLEKNITITVNSNSNKVKLSTPLIFYVNDKVLISFSIKELDYILHNGYSKSTTVKTVLPKGGFLSVETPLGIDELEAVSISEDKIYFELDSKYTSCVGKYGLQLFLSTSSGYQKAIPPFSFTVENTINEDLDGIPKKEVTLLLNELGECFLSSNNEIIVFK